MPRECRTLIMVGRTFGGPMEFHGFIGGEAASPQWTLRLKVAMKVSSVNASSGRRIRRTPRFVVPRMLS